MKIRTLVLGSLGTNTYILGSKNVAVVDPGANAEGIMNYIKGEELTVDKILVTHGHFDHVGALCELRELTKAPVYMHEDDIPMLGSMEKSLGFMTGEAPEWCEVDVVLYGGESISIEDEVLEVVHTPGHSSGSVSYVGDGFVVCGDLIFKESIGRYDFGNYNDEMESIDNLLSMLEDDCIILPGHGDETTVGREKENNPYIR